MQINFKPDAQNNITWAILQGRLDVAGVQDIEKEFQSQVEALDQPLLVDMSGVDFMGSLGIRLLLGGAKKLGQRGRRMILMQPPPLVEDTWYSAGLAELVPVEHDFANALALCRKTDG